MSGLFSLCCECSGDQMIVQIVRITIAWGETLTGTGHVYGNYPGYFTSIDTYNFDATDHDLLAVSRGQIQPGGDPYRVTEGAVSGFGAVGTSFSTDPFPHDYTGISIINTKRRNVLAFEFSENIQRMKIAYPAFGAVGYYDGGRTPDPFAIPPDWALTSVEVVNPAEDEFVIFTPATPPDPFGHSNEGTQTMVVFFPGIDPDLVPTSLSRFTPRFP